MNELSDIRRKLHGLRGRITTALMLDGGARTAGVLLAVVALSFLLDRVFKLETVARAVLLLGGVGAVSWVAWRYLVLRVGAAPGEDPLAIAVEKRFPELNDRLISAIQLSREAEPERYGMSPELIEDAIKEAFEPVSRVRFREVLAAGRVFKRVTLGAIAILLLAAGATADPESASIWFRRNVLLQSVRWPQKTYLEVDPERFPGRVARIVRGEDLVIVARSTGEVHPDRATIFYHDSEGDRGKATMKADTLSHIFRYEFKDIAFPITFHLEGGDEVTDPYRIELMEAPEVESLEIQVGFPAYADREPVAIDLAAGDPEMLVGGFVRIKGRSTKPLRSAQLVLGETEDSGIDAKLLNEYEFELTFAPRKTMLAGVRLHDTDGLTNPTLAPRFLVRVLEDRAPRVRLGKTGIGTMVVEGAVFPYFVRLRDDIRVVSGHLEVQKAAGDRKAAEPFVRLLPEKQLGRDEITVEDRLEISDLEVSPGAFLTFTAFARDNAEPEVHEGKSDPITVKVVTIEELLSELRRRQQEQRTLFEELISKERRLRDRFRDLRDTPPGSPQELRLTVEGQSQEQREIARRVRAIERSVTQILDEMLNNRVYQESRVAELRRTVVRALVNVRRKTMAQHAKDLDEFARRAESVALQGDDGAQIDSGYARVIQTMQAVLQAMVKVEDFAEIVARMRDILKLHGELRNETRRKYEAALAEVFEPEDDE